MFEDVINKAIGSFQITMTGDFLDNHMEMIKHHAKLEMMLWDAPVNKSQWATPPTKVNAFYHLENLYIF